MPLGVDSRVEDLSISESDLARILIDILTTRVQEENLRAVYIKARTVFYYGRVSEVSPKIERVITPKMMIRQIN